MRVGEGRGGEGREGGEVGGTRVDWGGDEFMGECVDCRYVVKHSGRPQQWLESEATTLACTKSTVGYGLVR